MVTIVDYGMGNLGSIQNMFKRIGAKARISADPRDLENAEKILLPGVGAFDSAMGRINSGRFRDVLDRKALIERVPVLGICLGMQLLTRSSEEGHSPGLGWIAAETLRFPQADGLKVPHMGWNAVIASRPSALTSGLAADARYYFVHSYFVRVDNAEDSVLKARYGVGFDAAIAHGNIFGAQFHPEKSHRFGMHLLSNFARL
jgi:imidazole glycerol-phosphate synthase subunit HisH